MKITAGKPKKFTKPVLIKDATWDVKPSMPRGVLEVELWCGDQIIASGPVDHFKPANNQKFVVVEPRKPGEKKDDPPTPKKQRPWATFEVPADSELRLQVRSFPSGDVVEAGGVLNLKTGKL